MMEQNLDAVDKSSKPPSQRLFILIGILWIVLGAVIFWQLPTAVGSIRVTWETETEQDNAGFNVYRAEAPAGATSADDCADTQAEEYTQVNDQLIGSTGNTVEGDSYVFDDLSAETDKRYCYQLEDVELSGRVERHPPIFGRAPRQFDRILYLVLAPLSLIVGTGLIISGFKGGRSL